MLVVLLVSRGVSGCQEAFFSFHLTPFQTQDISMRRYQFVIDQTCMVVTSTVCF